MPRVAIAQFDPHFADPEHNLDEIARLAGEASQAGARLVVFPECSLNGYVYASLDEAREQAEPIPGPLTQRLAALADRHDIHLVVGMLERVADIVFNTALLCGPRGFQSAYRKTHLLCLGVDRFTTPGNIPYRVHDLPIGRVGVLICYDLRFPESARVLALGGAQLIVLPTNWPENSSIQPDVLTRARAAENRVFVLAANRVGTEHGTRFLGRSQIVHPSGAVIAEASGRETQLLVADIDLTDADRKHVVFRPGEHEMDLFRDRRTDLYGSLTTPYQPVP